MDVVPNENFVRKRRQIRSIAKEEKKNLTANQVSIKKLDSIVNKKIKGGGVEHTIDEEDYEKYRRVLVNSDELIHLSMPVLAAVLRWLSENGNKLDDESYQNIDEYYNDIVEKHTNPVSTRGKAGESGKYSQNDKNIINLRMRFEFKRYADLILRLLAEQDTRVTDELEQIEIDYGIDEELVNIRHEQEIYY